MLLKNRHCEPVIGSQPLNLQQANVFIAELQQTWQLVDDQYLIFDFQFKNYDETMSFVNALAWIVRCQDHHPDLEVGYRHCRVRYSTHSIGGLSDNDFICAAKIEQLVL